VAVMERKPEYVGRLGRDIAGAYRGELVDCWGFRIRIEATVVETADGREFALTGRFIPALPGAQQQTRRD
jgi:hypothetical protein